MLIHFNFVFIPVSLTQILLVFHYHKLMEALADVQVKQVEEEVQVCLSELCQQFHATVSQICPCFE